jgi:hypothetical protein
VTQRKQISCGDKMAEAKHKERKKEGRNEKEKKEKEVR